MRLPPRSSWTTAKTLAEIAGTAQVSDSNAWIRPGSRATLERWPTCKGHNHHVNEQWRAVITMLHGLSRTRHVEPTMHDRDVTAASLLHEVR
jgi:hypothetical protein